ncbi:MAG TPA: Rieske 2Fe-2S domain-containing protein [Tepidisphaeraceae bacterium]|jgi:Rieske Fe-S protein|nr:Rieske 2Fe-2S domain-containing protein [Tepidisphaeraceae bacterium]
MSDLNRRDFVALAALTLAGSCTMCEGAFAADAEPRATPKDGPVDCGDVADYSKDGVYDKFAKSNGVMLISHQGKLIALSTKCTHKNCNVLLKEQTIACKCHGSRFDNDGKPTKGPAKAALFRYPIKKDEKNHVIVEADKTKILGEKEWDKDNASLKVA